MTEGNEAIRAGFEKWARKEAPFRLERFGTGYSSVSAQAAWMAWQAAMAARVPDGWLPIESAPKESPILVVGNHGVVELCVHEAYSGSYIWRKWRTDTYFHVNAFTHWMPLPKAPNDCRAEMLKAEAAKGGGV